LENSVNFSLSKSRSHVRGLELYLRFFLITALDGGQGSTFRSGSITSTKEPHGTHYVPIAVVPSGRCGEETFFLSLPGIDSPFLKR